MICLQPAVLLNVKPVMLKLNQSFVSHKEKPAYLVGS